MIKALERVLIALSLCLSIELTADGMWEEEKEKIISGIQDYQGWCAPEKANVLADLLWRTRPTACVEIGTFGGATLSVIAKTLRYNGNGFVVSIDAWSNQEAVRNFHPDTPFYQWWKQIDFPPIRDKLVAQLEKDDLSLQVHLLMMSSQDAVPLFRDESIDFLIIDGNHSQECVFFDVFHYYPKVKDGGYIFLNDTNWLSMRKALMYLLEYADLCSPYHDSAPFLIFKKSLATHRIADQLWK